MGKSASGKDSLYKKLLSSDLKLNKVAIYTTRPKRDGEVEGNEYYFVDKKFLDDNRNKIIEERVYHTVYGEWYYATLDDGKINKKDNYIIIGTLESYNALKKYFGKEMLFPIYLEVDNELRKKRALEREYLQKEPKISELERRFAADEIDFSEENIKNAEITKRYVNDDFDVCFKQIFDDIKSEMND